MREIIFCVILYATVAVTAKGTFKCDLNALEMPENADTWKCNKPVDQSKVERYTRCKLVCQDGYDLSRSKKLTPKF